MRENFRKFVTKMTEMSVHPLEDFRYCPQCGTSDFVVHDGKSKCCEGCGFVYYYNSAASTAAIILNERDELLVCRRAQDPARGTLDLPGGFCDCSETAEGGVVREVREETGLHVMRTTYLFSLPNRYLYSGFWVHTTDLFFRCEVPSSSVAIARDDASELLWIPRNDLKARDFGLESIRKGIEIFLSGNF